MQLLSLFRRSIVANLDPRLAPQFYNAFETNPVTIYDVGAAGSLFTPYAAAPTAWAPVFGFEPHDESFRRLTRGKQPEHTVVYQIALCSQDGDVSFHSGVGKARTLSSILSIDELGVDNSVIKIPGLMVDSVPNRLNIASANFIKLDPEGSEKIILENGAQMLRDHVLGIQCEVAFWRDTEGCVFSDVDKLLTQHGFVLFDLQMNRSDIRSIGGRKDKVRSGDALYLRNFDTLPKASNDKGLRRTQLLKLMSLATTLRYLNYALELADHGFRLGLLNRHEFAATVKPIIATVDLSDRIPSFPGRVALARLFDVLSYALQPNMKKGVPHAFNGLGNHWVVKRAGQAPTHVELYCPILSDGTQHRRKLINVNPNLTPNS